MTYFWTSLLVKMRFYNILIAKKSFKESAGISTINSFPWSWTAGIKMPLWKHDTEHFKGRSNYLVPVFDKLFGLPSSWKFESFCLLTWKKVIITKSLARTSHRSSVIHMLNSGFEDYSSCCLNWNRNFQNKFFFW